MKVFESCINVLYDLRDAIEQIPEEVYSQSVEIMFQASVGQHCRHIIEFFQCLQDQYSSGSVCYDLRKRDMRIEHSTLFAATCIEDLMDWLTTMPDDQALILMVNHELDDQEGHEKIQSSLVRELIFNIEHAIHHMAILKIGLKLCAPEIELPTHFGIAPSTIRHNQQQVNA